MLIPLGFLAGSGGSAILAVYFAGGFTTTRVSTVDKFSLPADTRTTLGTGLSAARVAVAGMANSTIAGYVGGGYNVDNGSSNVTTVDKFTYPTDSASTLGTGLATNRANHAAFANSGTAGYFAGGVQQSGDVKLTTVDKFAFPGESRSTLTIGLSDNKFQVAGMSNTGTAGYVSGGWNASFTLLSAVDKFSMPLDVRTTLGTGLSAATRNHAGFSNQATAGYFAGGSANSGLVTTVNKFAFPSDTRTTLGTGLSLSIDSVSGAGAKGVAGYVGGGDTGAKQSQVDKFAFPSDTRTTLATGLSSARAGTAGFSDEGAL